MCGLWLRSNWGFCTHELSSAVSVQASVSETTCVKLSSIPMVQQDKCLVLEQSLYVLEQPSRVQLSTVLRTAESLRPWPTSIKPSDGNTYCAPSATLGTIRTNLCRKLWVAWMNCIPRLLFEQFDASMMRSMDVLEFYASPNMDFAIAHFDLNSTLTCASILLQPLTM